VPEERQGEPAAAPAVATPAHTTSGYATSGHAPSARAHRVDATPVDATPVLAASVPAVVHTSSLRYQGAWEAVADLAQRRRSELGRPLRVLDLGGGTGGLAVPLAQLGHDVTVVDPSPNALAALERRASDCGVADRITARQGDADSLADLRRDGSNADVHIAATTAATDPLDTGTATDRTSTNAAEYDLVCCHGVLEVVDDPAGALTGIATVLAPAGHLSLLVAGRLAMVLAKALAGEVTQATEALTSVDGRWGRSDPLPRRFDLAQLTTLLQQNGFLPLQVHGVRVFTDLVPASAVDSAAGRAALADLERAVSTDPHYADALGNLGAGLHAIAQRSELVRT
jgi:S-adenosylmethionine-dependent methyltransferase